MGGSLRHVTTRDGASMLALILLVLTFVIIKSMRLPDWAAILGAFGAAIAARAYLPGFDIDMSGGTLALVVIGLILLPFVLGPALIYGTQRASATPTFDAYDHARHTVPPSIDLALSEAETALVAEGFAKVGDYFQTGFMANMTSRVALFEKPATRQEAIAVGIYMDAKPDNIIAHYVEVLARFVDGRSLAVNNAPVPNAYAPVRGKTIEVFPDVRDPRRLVRLHERLLATMGTPESRRPIDRGGDSAAYLSRAIVQESEQQIPTGYLRLDAEANLFRPTLKGAVLMTWAQLPPFSSIRRARTRRRAAALIAGLGVTEPDAAPVPVPALQKKVAWPAVAMLMMLMVYGANADTGLGGALVPAPQPFTVPADFTVPEDFPSAVRALEALTGSTAEQLTVIDSLGYPVTVNGARIGVEAERADALLAAAQAMFLERGFFLFRHEPNYGIGGAPDEIGLVPLRDQLDVVQLVGTNGANFDLSTAGIVAWLRALERDAPFVLTGIGYDHLEGRFLRPVGADAEALAARFHQFCPDVVDQGTGSVEELANEIARLNTFFCWWD